MNNQQA